MQGKRKRKRDDALQAVISYSTQRVLLSFAIEVYYMDDRDFLLHLGQVVVPACFDFSLYYFVRALIHNVQLRAQKRVLMGLLFT